jgi:hypothetical protein
MRDWPNVIRPHGFVRLGAADGTQWDVSDMYLAPVSIGEAERIAKEEGCELPTPALVDAIWRTADLKVAPLPRSHNGTIAQMASPPVYADQAARVLKQIEGQPFALLAGTHKDVVRCPRTGRLGLYGWHRLDGRVIQPLFTGHAMAWIDYSQGLRLCRRITT